MLTRREALQMTAAAAALGAAQPLQASAQLTGDIAMGDDGLHKQPWFTDSFLELGDDLQTAADQGRHLMVIWEQRGCPYCRELHEVNFRRREIIEYITAHFDVIQLNMFGSREVLDFDGEALEERRLAEKWAVNFTPTTQLFHAENVGQSSMKTAQTFRAPGYLKPFHYISSLEYVVTEDFRNQRFQSYLQDKFTALRAQGIDPDVW